MNKITFTAGSQTTSIELPPGGSIELKSQSKVDSAKVDLVAGTTDLRHSSTIQVANTTFPSTIQIKVEDVVSTPPPSWTPKFPGDVPPGKLRWGCSIKGNGDPARHETPANHRLPLRRRYVSTWSRRGNLANYAREDLSVGRLPWLSVKPPSWANMGAGQHNAEIDAVLKALGAIDGPIWLTVHHEPEGGGSGGNTPDDPAGPSAWREVQKRWRERIDALGIKNVALAPILMAYTFDPRSGRNPLDWWVPNVWDFAGIDYYIEDESATDVPTAKATWGAARKFYGDRGLPMASGEWGNRGTDVRAANEMQGFYDHAILSSSDGKGARIIGLSYFDSDLNSSTGGWMLTGEPLKKFQELIKDPRSILVKEQ